MTICSAYYGDTPRYMHSPFNAELAPTPLANLAGEYGVELYLGLLLGTPNVDGIGGIELPHHDQLKQRIELSPRSSRDWTIPRPVVFELDGTPMVKTLVLTDGSGNRLAYGVLRSGRSAVFPTDRIAFPSHQILIRRIRSSQ
ncbi:hypothetical protein MMB232_00719 [Brevundimonas subvibrioides]|uniref:hypothetical protein n=1 Tax=Brevundimonas subvibrioides TaxID=74313 RepID=UPI0032D59B35